MAVNLATKYAKKVDERFKLKSLTDAFINRDYDWEGAKTIKVWSIPTVALNNYSRTGTNRYGTPNELQDTVADYTLSQDKSFTFTIDKGNNVDQMNIKGAGKALQREIDEVIVPEKDIYRLGKIAAAAVANSGTATAAVNKTNAYEKFLAGQTYLDNNKVPVTGRVAAISASFYALIKQDSSFVKSGDLSQKMLVNGQVGEIDGVKLVKVPASYLPTNCEFIIEHPSSTVSPAKLTEYKIHDNPPGINGNLVEGRVRFDTFVLEAKKNAVYAHYTTAPSSSTNNG
jgi:N4-gp56 family major capsid protein